MKFQKTITILLILVMMASLSVCALAEGTIVIGGNPETPSDPAAPQDPAHLYDNPTEPPAEPSSAPATEPTAAPSEAPTTPTPVAPETAAPTAAPTVAPTAAPTVAPTATPSGTFKITKSPLSEPNIVEGNGTSFTAKAENATSVTWHVLNEKGVEVSADQWGSYGISVASSDPANSKISIHNASTKISGWSFYAVFTGAGTSSATDKASIKVAPNSQALPAITTRPVITPVPTATPTPTPTATPTPTPTATPTATPTPAPTAVPEASFAPMATQDPALSVEAASATQARSSSLAPILIVILCGVIIAAAAVTAILYANGMIGGRRR